VSYRELFAQSGPKGDIPDSPLKPGLSVKRDNIAKEFKFVLG
jgi:hypothetical protein